MSSQLTTPPPPRRPLPGREPAPPLVWDDEEEPAPGFFRRHRLKLSLGFVAASVGGLGWMLATTPSGPAAPVRHSPETIIRVQLPPPPPPPPKIPPPPPPQDKMVEQTPVAEPPAPPAPAPPKAEPPPGLGTGVKGNGAGDSFGLGASGNGVIGGTGQGGGGGSQFGWYAGQVQRTIADALRQNPKTRTAQWQLQVRIWPGPTGRITRAQLSGSTGDPALDAALARDILTGLQLPAPPPAGMKLPIVLRLSAQRPP